MLILIFCFCNVEDISGMINVCGSVSMRNLTLVLRWTDRPVSSRETPASGLPHPPGLLQCSAATPLAGLQEEEAAQLHNRWAQPADLPTKAASQSGAENRALALFLLGPVFVRNDGLPMGSCTKYTWHITDLSQVKRIFDTPEVKAHVTSGL